MSDNSTHYNSVTDAWQTIMGDNFHFGYFQTPDTPLTEAASALIDKMISFANVTQDTRVLDVGCGIGTPAFYLYDKFKCSVTGISTSDKGIEVANQRSESRGCSEKVRFRVADGTDNGLPSGSFDIVWAMESSHLMKKRDLIRECHRVLRPGGTLLLCDIMRHNFTPYIIKPWYAFPERVRDFRYIKRAFGRVWVAPLGYYWNVFHKTGFGQITTLDIAGQAFPTLRNWRENTINNRYILRKYLSDTKIDYFIKACDAMEKYFANRLLIYAIMKGIK
jgi:27-O-demethylrifamycin SV methyltransferase